MSSQKATGFVIEFVIILVFLQIGEWLGLPFLLIIAVTVVAFMAFRVGRVAWQRWRYRWIMRYGAIIQRVKAGDGEAVYQELSARYARGSRTFDTLMGLVLASSFTQRFEDGDPYLEEARARVEREGLCVRSDTRSRFACDLILYGEFDRMVRQGRFSEAAHSLRPRVPDAASPNYMTAIIAWGFFLADDRYNAQVVLDNVKPGSDPKNHTLYITLEYQFMVAYMRHALFGEDTRADLLALIEQYADWQNDAARHAGNLYGQRLRAILDDIRPLLPDSAVQNAE